MWWYTLVKCAAGVDVVVMVDHYSSESVSESWTPRWRVAVRSSSSLSNDIRLSSSSLSCDSVRSLMAFFRSRTSRVLREREKEMERKRCGER